jgi:DNA-binding IclR family transcriptional regulator
VERHEGGYRLGPRLVIGGGAAVTSEELIRRADPVLETLVAETGETAIICRRIGLAAVCLHQRESNHPLRVALEPGASSRLDVGAASRVLLAYAPEDIQAAILGPSPAAAARRSLARITLDGVARSEGEYISDTVTIAVPVLREDGIVAALAVIAPRDRAGQAWQARTARRLVDGAAAIAGSRPSTNRIDDAPVLTG